MSYVPPYKENRGTVVNRVRGREVGLALIPEDVVESVRDRADIGRVVGRYVTLKQSGTRHWGLCPFHSEKTPSFQVRQDAQAYYCFGCGEGGDVFAFLMRHDGMDFPDAVRSLARELGIPVPEATGAAAGKASRIHAANEAALAYFRRSLQSNAGDAARAYLRSRAIPPALIERFGIGFAPAAGLLADLRRQGIEPELAEQAGLLARSQVRDGYYDRFRARLVFPIGEPSGHILGFGARALDAETVPKYLNSKESPTYHKGRVLFGLPLALDGIRRAGRVVVVEGYFDVLALHQAGIEEVVAPCGTALTSDQARRLSRYTREIVLLFDGDAAGRQASERALPTLLGEGLRVRAVFLPEDEDPDTHLRKRGAEALRERVDAAEPLLDTLVDRYVSGPAAHAWDAADAVRAVAPLLQAIRDPVEAAAYVGSVAGRLRVPPEDVRRQLAGGDRRDRGVRERLAPAPADREAPRARLDPTTRALIAALVAYPELLPLVGSPQARGVLPDMDCELLERVCGAIERHGPRARGHLISAGPDGLSDAVRPLLLELLAGAEAADEDAARRAIQDCVAQIRIRALKQEARQRRDRLGSCKDPAEQEVLLRELEQNAAERRELWSQVQHV